MAIAAGGFLSAALTVEGVAEAEVDLADGQALAVEAGQGELE